MGQRTGGHDVIISRVTRDTARRRAGRGRSAGLVLLPTLYLLSAALLFVLDGYAPE